MKSLHLEESSKADQSPKPSTSPHSSLVKSKLKTEKKGKQKESKQNTYAEIRQQKCTSSISALLIVPGKNGSN